MQREITKEKKRRLVGSATIEGVWFLISILMKKYYATRQNPNFRIPLYCSSAPFFLIETLVLQFQSSLLSIQLTQLLSMKSKKWTR